MKSIEPVLRSKRSAAQSESLTHMVGCLVNYVAKVAHATDHTPLAMWAVRIGRELLNPSSSAAAGETSGKSGGATSSKKRKSRSIQVSPHLISFRPSIQEYKCLHKIVFPKRQKCGVHLSEQMIFPRPLLAATIRHDPTLIQRLVRLVYHRLFSWPLLQRATSFFLSRYGRGGGLLKKTKFKKD